MMSYDNMDHADWVERNIAAAKSGATKRDKAKGAQGIGWCAAPAVLNPFQRQAFNILGVVGRGIYNAPIEWTSLRWTGVGGGLCVPWRGHLSTFDFIPLTELVFLAHEARIRVEIRSKTFRHLEIMLHPRGHDGASGNRHPSLEEAVSAFSARFPACHPVKYRARVMPEVPAA